MIKTLYIFDIDDTIIRTVHARVYLKDENRYISASEYTAGGSNGYDSRGDRFDFTEFDDDALLRLEEKLPAFEKLKNSPTEDTHILTARQNHDGIYNWLCANGVGVYKSHIRCWDKEKYWTLGAFKGDMVRQLLHGSDYTHVHIFEDSAVLIRAMIDGANEVGGVSISIN